MCGVDFFAKSDLAGLTNYIIRHKSKYGNMTSLSQALQSLDTSQALQTYLSLFEGHTLRVGATVYHQLHCICRGLVCRIPIELSHRVVKAPCPNLNIAQIWYFSNIHPLFMWNSSVPTSYALTSSVYTAQITFFEVGFLPKLGLPNFFFVAWGWTN